MQEELDEANDVIDSMSRTIANLQQQNGSFGEELQRYGTMFLDPPSEGLDIIEEYTMDCKRNQSIISAFLIVCDPIEIMLKYTGWLLKCPRRKS